MDGRSKIRVLDRVTSRTPVVSLGVFFLIEHRSCWCLILIRGSEMPSGEPAAVSDLLVDTKGSSGQKIGHRSMFVHRNPVVDNSDPSVGMHDVPASGLYDHDGLQSFLW